jgi:hypothetical protein
MLLLPPQTLEIDVATQYVERVKLMLHVQFAGVGFRADSE